MRAALILFQAKQRSAFGIFGVEFVFKPAVVGTAAAV